MEHNSSKLKTNAIKKEDLPETLSCESRVEKTFYNVLFLPCASRTEHTWAGAVVLQSPDEGGSEGHGLEDGECLMDVYFPFLTCEYFAELNDEC